MVETIYTTKNPHTPENIPGNAVLGELASSIFCLLLVKNARKYLPDFAINPTDTLAQAECKLEPFLGYNFTSGLIIGQAIDKYTETGWIETQRKVSKLTPPPGYLNKLREAQKRDHACRKDYLTGYRKTDKEEDMEAWKVVGDAAFQAALMAQAEKGFRPSRRPFFADLWEGLKDHDSPLETAETLRYAMWELRTADQFPQGIYLSVFLGNHW